jgi:predicted Rossmann fold nucleotide-binding protein DprA/Smf involved in DNA uptake
MTILKKDLQALNKDLKALSTKMEKLIKEFDKGKTAKVTKKIIAKPTKAKTTKKVPAKKALAKKRPAKLTATDIVLGILMADKRAVNVATLIKKTRFDEKKIQNVLYKAKKMGKVKRVGKGVYMSA